MRHPLRAEGHRPRAAVVAAALGMGLVFAACGNDSTPSALDPKGDSAEHIAALWWLLFSLATVVYLVVAGFIVWSWRRRASADLRINRIVAIGGVFLPVLVLTVAGVETIRTTSNVFTDRNQEADVVVIGERWWWRVSYPDSAVVTANEVHIPTGEPVTVELRSDNVVHSFWVPELTGKVDLIPGQTNHVVLETDHPGTYQGACAEFCGIQHANMRFIVVAHEPDDFRDWIDARRTPPAEPTGPAAEGQQVFLSEPCAGCHTIRGTDASGTLGPDLTDVGGRTRIGAGTVKNTPENLAQWVHDARSLKPGAVMPPIELTAPEIDVLVAYLESLDPA